MKTLKGMTWDHSRGYDPMIETSEIFCKKYNNQIYIEWDKRSLQAFADRPIEQMVDEYDLMVIDYPHVGEVSAKGLLQQFDVEKYNNQLDNLNEQSVGLSHQSYNIDGHQWALAIDAATQVSCYREDLIEDVPGNWNELLALAKNQKIIWPLKPVHAISSFYSIYNNITDEFDPLNKEFVDKEFGIQTLRMMKEISNCLIQDCFSMDPIRTAEILSETNDFYYAPYTYGFSNYSRKDYRKNILKYGNVIDLDGKGPHGTHLGGTGIAISNSSKYKDIALEYSYWIAGADCQQTIFYESGGQPGNSVAWQNKEINDHNNWTTESSDGTLVLPLSSESYEITTAPVYVPTIVKLTSTSGSVNENAGQVPVSIEIVNAYSEDSTAVQLVFSGDNSADFNSFVSDTVVFAKGVSEAQSAIIASFLPEQLSEEEVFKIVKGWARNQKWPDGTIVDENSIVDWIRFGEGEKLGINKDASMKKREYLYNKYILGFDLQ